MAQKNKIAGYIRAKKLIDSGKTQFEACKTAGISRMTFNKYREMFGDAISETQIEVLPQDKQVPRSAPGVESKSDLDRILAENAALEQQLKLRAELAKYVH